MNVDSSLSQGTAPDSVLRRWADDGGLLTEQQPPEPEPTDPEPSFEAGGSATDATVEIEAVEPVDVVDVVEPVEPAEVVEPVGTVTETSMTATSEPAASEPLLSDTVDQDFRTRWSAIQIGFVEDPPKSVRDADGLMDEIAAALLESMRERRADLAADWQNGSPGTEELRLALQRYHAFISVILPR